MKVIFDVARDFKMVVIDEEKPMYFSIPSEIEIGKLKDKRVKAWIGREEMGDFEISFKSKDFSFFSPPESLLEPFRALFNYYFFHTLNQKLSGQEVEEVYIVLPFYYSFDVENFFINTGIGKYKPIIYREVEALTSYYLNESTDSTELNLFSEKDSGAHIYGIFLTGDSLCLFFINYTLHSPPEIIDYVNIDNSADFFNILRMNILKHSSTSKKSRIFYFIEKKAVEKLNLSDYEKTKKEFEKEIESDIKIPIRNLRYMEGEDTILKGIINLDKKNEMVPEFKLSLFTQEDETTFSRIIPGKNIRLIIDPKDISSEFFINLFIGFNTANVILLKRLFLDMKGVKEKPIELKARFEKAPNGLNYKLIFKDKVYKEGLILLRKQFRIILEKKEV